MKLGKMNWKAIAVFVLMAVFIFSAFQPSMFSAKGASSNSLNLISQISVKGVHNSGYSISQSNTPAHIINGVYYYNVSIAQSGLTPGLSWGIYILNNSTEATSSAEFASSYTNGNNWSNANTPNYSQFTSYGFSSGNNINLTLTNGTYYYVLTVMNSTYFSYEMNSDIQNMFFSIQGNSLNMSVNFPVLKKVTLSAQSLRSGTKWTIAMGGSLFDSVSYYNSSLTGTMIAYLTLGYYNYSYTEGIFQVTAVNPSELVVTSTSTILDINIMKTVPVTFSETGLSPGFNWQLYVSYYGTTVNLSLDSFINMMYVNTTSNTGFTIYLPNGTYSYTVKSGSFSNSFPTGLTVNRTLKQSYSVSLIIPKLNKYVFSETGITSGEDWGVLVAWNYTASSSSPYDVCYINGTGSSSLIAYLPNGTLKYTPVIGSVSLLYSIPFFGIHGTFFKTTGFTVNSAGSISITFPAVQKIAVNIHGIFPGLTYAVCLRNYNTGSIIYQNTSSNSSFVSYLPSGTYTIYVNSTYLSIKEYFNQSFSISTYGFTINVSVHIYKVTVIAYGLHKGMDHLFSFKGIVGGNSKSQNSTFYLENGTYDYTYSVWGLSTFSTSQSSSFNVSGNNTTVKIYFPHYYKFVFNEVGLIQGKEWGIQITSNTVNEISNETLLSQQMIVYLVKGNYTYSFGIYNSTTASISNPTTGSLTVSSLTPQIINLKEVSQYTVSFTETGLPTSVDWTVEFNGTSKTSTSSTISFLEPNGTYAFDVQPISGYSIAPQSGSIVVRNSSIYKSILFTPIISSQAPVWAFTGAYANYSLTFVYNGKSTISNVMVKAVAVNLSNDTVELQMITMHPTSNVQNTTLYDHWNNFSLWLGKGLISKLNNGSAVPGFSSSNITPSVKITTPAGTFLTDGLYETTSGGNLNFYYEMYSGILVDQKAVINSTGSLIAVLTSTNIPEGNASLSNYQATFTESGLPSGTAWYVNLSNGMNSGAITGSSYSFALTNGTYSYNIATTDKIYHASAGSITVSGKNISQAAAFSKYTYKITFTETGLPSGTHWSMTFNGATSSSNGTTITFNAVNGTYSYTVVNISGYSISPGSGSLSVNGKNVPVNIKFSQISGTSGGLTQTEVFAIIGAAAAVIAVLGIILFKRRK